jgi:hypothetical protein
MAICRVPVSRLARFCLVPMYHCASYVPFRFLRLATATSGAMRLGGGNLFALITEYKAGYRCLFLTDE